MSAYYKEHDPFAAAWLRELIKAGHIAPEAVHIAPEVGHIARLSD